jgi:hypothetical protein
MLPGLLLGLLGLLVAALLSTGPTAYAAVSLPPAAVSLPPAGGFDYQLGGGYAPADGVRTVVRDRTERPAAGYYNVCYVNAFQAQPDQLSWWRAHHPRLLLRAHGREVRDAAWGETLLDTSTRRKRAALARVLGRWIMRCAAAGFRAVEPDNLDSFTRSRGRVTARDNLALASLLIRRAHRAGLAIAQKNAPGLARRGHERGFDFAVAEECAVWHECAAYTRAYGQHLLQVEYADNGARTFPAACRAAGGRWPVVLRDRDLRPAGRAGHVFRAC